MTVWLIFKFFKIPTKGFTLLFDTNSDDFTIYSSVKEYFSLFQLPLGRSNNISVYFKYLSGAQTVFQGFYYESRN